MSVKERVNENFSIEYAVEDATLTERMKAKVQRRMRKLVNGYKDIFGVAVALRNVTGTKRNPDYKCRMIIYAKPVNIVAVQNASMESVAMLGALDSVERQIRDRRERMRERHRAKKS